MAVSPATDPLLVIYPSTLTDLTVVSNWADSSTETYTLADADRTHADYRGALVIALSNLTESRLASSAGTVIISSTGCQTQTLQIIAAAWHEITMEPAPGYKKMYAWNDGSYYTNSATPSAGDEVYRYDSSSDKYIVYGTVISVSTNTMDVQPFG